MTTQSLLIFLGNAINSSADDMKVWDAINFSVRKIAEHRPWSFLRRTIAITSATTDTEGTLMPANMINVIDPISDAYTTAGTTGFIYQRLDPALIQVPPSPYMRYFYFDGTITTPLVDSTTGVSIKKNTTALTFNPVLGATDYSGEFIHLAGNDGQDWGIHELASNTDLVNTYKGGRISGGYYVIRPSTAKRLSFSDITGVRIAATPTVHYWVYPEPVLAPEQVLPDIWEEPLRRKCILELQTETYDIKPQNVRISKSREYDIALSTAVAADPAPPIEDIPRDNLGLVRSIGWRSSAYAGPTYTGS